MADGFVKDAEGYWIAKDPSATKNYTIDFTRWLEAGDTLTSVVWTVPVGITRGADNVLPSKAVIQLGGGVVGQNYIISAHIITSLGREDDRSFRLVIRDQ